MNRDVLLEALTPHQRADAYEAAFPDRVKAGGAFQRGHDAATGEERVFASWMGGQDYRNKSKLYGCLDGETRLLTADLRWVKQCDVRVGDELMGVSENPTAEDRRKMEVARVTAVGPVRLPTVRVKIDDGTEMLCSTDHKWLVRFPSGVSSRWLDVSKLRLGDQIRRVVPPWPEPDPRVAGWMGGIIDGEAHLSRDSGLVLRISQNPGAVLSRICATLDGWDIPYRLYEKKGHRCKDVCLPSTTATLRLMGLAPTERFARKWAGHGLPISSGKWATVVGLEAVGDTNLFGMTTSTHTFVAEGLASHNSYPAGYLERVFSMFPDARRVLHLFSGSLTTEQVEEAWRAVHESKNTCDDWRPAPPESGWSAMTCGNCGFSPQHHASPVQVRFDNALHPIARAAKPDVIGNAEELEDALLAAGVLSDGEPAPTGADRVINAVRFLPFDLILADPPYRLADQRRYWRESGLEDCKWCGAPKKEHAPVFNRRTLRYKLGCGEGGTGLDTTAFYAPKVRFKPLNKKAVLAECAKVLAPGGNLVWLDETIPHHANRVWNAWGKVTWFRSTGHRVRALFFYERRK